MALDEKLALEWFTGIIDNLDDLVGLEVHYYRSSFGQTEKVAHMKAKEAYPSLRDDLLKYFEGHLQFANSHCHDGETTMIIKHPSFGIRFYIEDEQMPFECKEVDCKYTTFFNKKQKISR